MKTIFLLLSKLIYLRHHITLMFLALSGAGMTAFAIPLSETSTNTNNDTNKPVTITLAADNAYMPYSFVDNQSASGVLIELVKKIDENLPEFTIQVKQMSWRRAKNAVRKGEVLGILGSYFHGHDWPKVYPYSYPIFYEHLVTVCGINKSNIDEGNTTRKWPEAYAGTIIGTVAGYDGWGGTEFRNKATSSINFFEFPNASLALMGVYKEVVDCTLIEKANFIASKRHLTATGKLPSDVQFSIRDRVSTNSVHIGYADIIFNSDKHAYASAFQKAFDTQLFLLRESGEIETLLSQFNIAVNP